MFAVLLYRYSMKQSSLTDHKDTKQIAIANSIPTSKIFIGKKICKKEKVRSNQEVLNWHIPKANEES